MRLGPKAQPSIFKSIEQNRTSLNGCKYSLLRQDILNSTVLQTDYMNGQHKKIGRANTNLMVIRSIYIEFKWETGSKSPSSKPVIDKNQCLPA